MEAEMADDREIDFSTLDWRELDQHQWIALRRNAIQRARRLRLETYRAVACGLAAAISGIAVGAGRTLSGAFARLKTASGDRHAITRLQSLDDRTLQDLGLRRSEIESFVHAHGGDETRIRRDRPMAA
jgi:uncharacterized protein YjiS (DUF1127 family)